MLLREKWKIRMPVTHEIASSNLVGSANDLTHWSSMEYNVLHEGKNAETRLMGNEIN